MTPSVKQYLSGWGRAKLVECAVFRPEKISALEASLSQAPTLISRGLGRAYGDAAINKEGVILSERLNRFLSFDPKTGLLQAESGVSLQEILALSVPQGWMVPVVPGTRFVTLGGMIASNIHGKNHYRSGEIARHVTALTLRLPSNEIIECSRDKELDIFWATVGGMGLTGHIEDITLQLVPLQCVKLAHHRERAKDIESLVELFLSHRDSKDYMVAWIDHSSQASETLGKGIFEWANHISEPSLPSPYTLANPLFNVPFDMPAALLNRYSLKAYNAFRFRRSARPKTSEVNMEDFFFPLDSIGQWNRLYGKQGMLQYQLLVPETAQAPKQLKNILGKIHQHALLSNLAVMKYHGAHEGLLSFSEPGFSLALDFPNTPNVRTMLDALDEYLLTIGGKVYLGKDARLKASVFKKMYSSQLGKWQKIVKPLDPQKRVRSCLSDRLELK